MRRWFAGWLSYTGAALVALADVLYPPYPERMRRTVQAHITVGEPSPSGHCVRCNDATFTFPLTAILPTGVMPAGSVEACLDCDQARDVVQEYLTRGWNN